MKEIKNYDSPKYNGEDYKLIEDNIYETIDEDDDGERIFVTSLMFVQEPELDEGDSADNISQYPLEDILDEFLVYVSDFYSDLNTEDSQICYLEFAAPKLEDVQNLRSVIGKHVYNKQVGEYVKLIIE